MSSRWSGPAGGGADPTSEPPRGGRLTGQDRLARPDHLDGRSRLAGRDHVGGRSRLGGRAGLARLHRLVPRPLAGPGRRARWRRSQLRRVLAALLVGVAAWAALGAVLPDPVQRGLPLVVLDRDLPAGAVLTGADLRLAHWQPAQRPARALVSVGAAVGRTLASAGSAGEPLTATRLLGVGALSNLPIDRVAAHLPLDDPGLSSYLLPGEHVDVISRVSGTVVAADVVLLSIDAPPAAAAWSGTGADTTGSPAGVVVAVSTSQAARLARISSGQTPGAGAMLALHRPD